MENVLFNRKGEGVDFVNKDNVEKSVAEAAISGSKDAFLSLMNLHKEYLYKTAYLYVKNENEASEIYQNTVYKAYINIHRLKSPQYFKTWVTRILINNINDHYRKSKKQKELYNKKEIIEINIEEIALEDKIDLYDAIDSLRISYKTSIILRYIHDMSIKDISKIMHCSESAVKSYIYRAKRELLITLKEV